MWNRLSLRLGGLVDRCFCVSRPTIFPTYVCFVTIFLISTGGLLVFGNLWRVGVCVLGTILRYTSYFTGLVFRPGFTVQWLFHHLDIL